MMGTGSRVRAVLQLRRANVCWGKSTLKDSARCNSRAGKATREIARESRRSCAGVHRIHGLVAQPRRGDVVPYGHFSVDPPSPAGLYICHCGRKPPAKIEQLARRDPGILVTGTVADVRGYLWGSSISIVPLRIGGGTRLKIYESMAAKVPVVSTSVGAEGLAVNHGKYLHCGHA